MKYTVYVSDLDLPQSGVTYLEDIIRSSLSRLDELLVVLSMPRDLHPLSEYEDRTPCVPAGWAGSVLQAEERRGWGVPTEGEDKHEESQTHRHGGVRWSVESLLPSASPPPLPPPLVSPIYIVNFLSG